MPLRIEENRAKIIRTDVLALAWRAPRCCAICDGGLVESFDRIAIMSAEGDMVALADDRGRCGDRIKKETPIGFDAECSFRLGQALERISKRAKAGAVERHGAPK